MKTKSDITKKYQKIYIIASISSFLLIAAPFIYYLCLAFAQGQPHQKLVLGCTVAVCGIMVFINACLKLRLRSGFWVLLIGIYFCIKNIQTMLIVVAMTSIADELIVEPIAKWAKSRYVINNQIDRRI